jgi:hypothetical protein
VIFFAVFSPKKCGESVLTAAKHAHSRRCRIGMRKEKHARWPQARRDVKLQNAACELQLRDYLADLE